jgi:hypothetical protein
LMDLPGEQGKRGSGKRLPGSKQREYQTARGDYSECDEW